MGKSHPPPQFNNFINRSKAVLLLWIIRVISVLCLLCFRARLFIDAIWSPAGKGLTSRLSFVMSNCVFVTFQCGIMSQVWDLIISIPDLCTLSYFKTILCCTFTFSLAFFFNFVSETPFYFTFILRVHVRHLKFKVRPRSIIKRSELNLQQYYEHISIYDIRCKETFVVSTCWKRFVLFSWHM